MINPLLTDGPSRVFSSQPDLLTAKQGLQIIQLIFDWRRRIKADFSFLAWLAHIRMRG
jgi:hypothetical protein